MAINKYDNDFDIKTKEIMINVKKKLVFFITCRNNKGNQYTG